MQPSCSNIACCEVAASMQLSRSAEVRSPAGAHHPHAAFLQQYSLPARLLPPCSYLAAQRSGRRREPNPPHAAFLQQYSLLRDCCLHAAIPQRRGPVAGGSPSPACSLLATISLAAGLLPPCSYLQRRGPVAGGSPVPRMQPSCSNIACCGIAASMQLSCSAGVRSRWKTITRMQPSCSNIACCGIAASMRLSPRWEGA